MPRCSAPRRRPGRLDAGAESPSGWLRPSGPPARRRRGAPATPGPPARAPAPAARPRGGRTRAAATAKATIGGEDEHREPRVTLETAAGARSMARGSAPRGRWQARRQRGHQVVHLPVTPPASALASPPTATTRTPRRVAGRRPDPDPAAAHEQRQHQPDDAASAATSAGPCPGRGATANVAHCRSPSKVIVPVPVRQRPACRRRRS